MSTESTAITPENTQEQSQQGSVWMGGAASPMKSSYGKLMMWFLIVSDAFSFAGLLITYAALRLSAEWWPHPAEQVFRSIPGVPGENYPLIFVTIMTFILIMSSVFVVRAVQEGHRMNKQGVMFWMFLGILGGAAFLGCQALEWEHLIHQGLGVFENPFGYYLNEAGEAVAFTWDNVHGQGLVLPDEIAAMNVETFKGPSGFGTCFFVITGFHGFHVFSGVLINIIIFIQASRGVYQKRGHYEMVEKVGLYWHFVDLVWVFVFLAFYLL